MATQPQITYDNQGHARFFQLTPAGASAEHAIDLTVATPAPTARENAEAFLAANADTLGLAPEHLNGVELAVNAVAPVPQGGQGLRFEDEKRLMDSTTVAYAQTMYGLPIYQAGISVTTQGPRNDVTAASSTLHYGVAASPPKTGLAPATSLGVTAENGAYDQLVRQALGTAGAGARINGTSLLVYRYEADKRTTDHPHDTSDHGFGGEPPTLALPPVPPQIVEGTYYVVVDALFSLPVTDWGMLNWRAFIELDTGAVLFLRALVDGITGLVFTRDPITKTGNNANLPTAASATLDVLRDNVPLVNLLVGSPQALSGNYVRLFDNLPPNIPAPTTVSPFNFGYVSRTNDFAAANAYFNCNRFFQMVSDLGFTISSYFDGTSFPVPVDHRGLGNVVNANCVGNALSNGVGQVNFALADTTDLSNPIGIAADWRVVLHELGGHGILWDHVNSPNLGFSHSAGDGIAAIVNDPGSSAPDRFVTFPWVNIGRRHDRPVNGWGFGGANDVGGYSTEQILATTHFRIYRSIGGDSADLARQQFASRSMVYLIMRAVGQLTPATNPPNPLSWEGQLETADNGIWTSTNPPGTFAGGAYHKVIRWGFEKQGLFRAPGAPATVEGVPPPVDVFIDDGRHGEYPFQPNHWSCTDIWNRRTLGAGGGVHEEPVVGHTNYAYVRIKNRGTQGATSVVVKGFHCLPGVGLTFPTDWMAMTTPQLAAPNLAAADMTGEIVGPFLWTPSQVGHECMFFSVSAQGDAGNIDGHVVGPIPEWRLVPHDNNLGQRNVHPVIMVKGGKMIPIEFERLPFWIRNHGRTEVVTTAEVHVPAWFAKLGWEIDLPSLTRQRAVMKPGSMLKVALSLARQGKPFTAEELARQRDRNIVIAVKQDGMTVGGMTFQIAAA